MELQILFPIRAGGAAVLFFKLVAEIEDIGETGSAGDLRNCGAGTFEQGGRFCEAQGIQIGNSGLPCVPPEYRVKGGFGEVKDVGQLTDGDFFPKMHAEKGQDVPHSIRQAFLSFCQREQCLHQPVGGDHTVTSVVGSEQILKKTAGDTGIGKDRRQLKYVLQIGPLHGHLQEYPTRAHVAAAFTDIMSDILPDIAWGDKSGTRLHPLKASVVQPNLISPLQRLHDRQAGEHFDVAQPVAHRIV